MNRIARAAKRFGVGRAVCLVLLAGLVLLRVSDPQPLEALRLRTFDFYQVIKPREVTLKPAVVVDINEQSLEALGQWPWPRTLLADLVTKLTQRGAIVIAFDIIFAEPDRMSPAVAVDSFRNVDDQVRDKLRQMPSNDAMLADAMRGSRVVVGESGYHLPLPKTESDVPMTGFATLGVDPGPFVIAFPGLLRNVPALEQAAAGRGLLTVRPEFDGIVRRVPMILREQGTLAPSLTLEMLRVATGANTILVKTDPAGIRSVAVPGLELPTDRNGQLWIYFSPHDQSRYVSAKDVLQDRMPADRVERRLVLIGTSAVGLRDVKTTPVDPAMSGVEVHAQVLENALTGSALAYPNYAIGAELASAVLIGLIIIAVGPVLGAAMLLAMGAAVSVLLIGVSWYFFTQHHLLIDFTFPLLSSFVVYLTLIFINYFREQFQRHRIRTAFGQYLAPSLVEQLAQSHETLTLGGEQREMTVLFSDVRGFTTISELYKHDPRGLTSLMNNFLTPMTNAIIDHHGTIDKYMGDAIMAFWNAPLTDHAHELNACNAALEMLQRVEALNKTREQEAQAAGQPFIPIKIGVGINTGQCVVGNMGSDLRFNYSVLGDSVNLASRLEGQTKSYGVPILIGSRTAEKAKDKFAVLELDFITVKGKTEPEVVYTVLGKSDVAESEQFQRVRQMARKMLISYRKQEWSQAWQEMELCRAAAAGLGLESLWTLYAERIQNFRANPPSSNWNGVFELHTK